MIDKWTPVEEGDAPYNVPLILTIERDGRRKLEYMARYLQSCYGDDARFYDWKMDSLDDVDVIAWMEFPNVYMEDL